MLWRKIRESLVCSAPVGLGVSECRQIPMGHSFNKPQTTNFSENFLSEKTRRVLFVEDLSGVVPAHADCPQRNNSRKAKQHSRNRASGCRDPSTGHALWPFKRVLVSEPIVRSSQILRAKKLPWVS